MVRGVVTPDGCPVEAYAALPAEPDLSSVLVHLEGRRKILDLGAGAGRIADPLAAAGFDVLAVDESPEMLDRVRHARRRISRIEELACEEHFDAVLLLSHLVNTPAATRRRQVLAAAARHLVDDGIVVIQRHDPEAVFHSGQVQLGDVEVSLLDVDTGGWPTVRAITRYRVGAHSWDQPWEAVVLSDDELTRALHESGLEPRLIDRSWVIAGRRAAAS